MIPDFGNLALYTALIINLWLIFSNIRYIFFSKNYSSYDINNHTIINSNKFNLFAWIAIVCCIAISFLCLIYCYVTSDFSVINVVMHSHVSSPLLYKIAGTWGNHEGSMLFLVLILALLSLLSNLYCIFIIPSKSSILDQSFRLSASSPILTNPINITDPININYKKYHNISENFLIQFSTIQSILLVFFLIFVIFTSNPFLRIFPVPITGLGFNPILQDIGLAMHPPVLYVGYIGMSVQYSLTIAFILCSIKLGRWRKTKAVQQYPSEHIEHIMLIKIWLKMMKPWMTLSWSWLTLGIGLGSWWAYRELGWGGFWFWDAVENAALMPWLASTSLIHMTNQYECKINLNNNNENESENQYEKQFKIKDKVDSFYQVIIDNAFLQRVIILMNIVCFACSIIGIFLVRSGIITSVHSFANDPMRGFYIFVFLFVLILYSMIIFYIYHHITLQKFQKSLYFDHPNNQNLLFVASNHYTDHNNQHIYSKQYMHNTHSISFIHDIFLYMQYVMLGVCLFTIMFGTFYPVLLEIINGQKITVGATYFITMICPLLLICGLLCSINQTLIYQTSLYKCDERILFNTKLQKIKFSKLMHKCKNQSLYQLVHIILQKFSVTIIALMQKFTLISIKFIKLNLRDIYNNKSKFIKLLLVKLLFIIAIVFILSVFVINLYQAPNLTFLNCIGAIIGLLLIINCIYYLFINLSCLFLPLFSKSDHINNQNFILLRRIVMLIGHLAFGIAMFGISYSALGSIEKTAYLKIGESTYIRDFYLKLEDISYAKGENYISKFCTISVNKKNIHSIFQDQNSSQFQNNHNHNNNDNGNGNGNNNDKKILMPELRLYTAEKQITYETAIYHNILYDIYVSISDIIEDNESTSNIDQSIQQVGFIASLPQQSFSLSYLSPYLSLLQLSSLLSFESSQLLQQVKTLTLSNNVYLSEIQQPLFTFISKTNETIKNEIIERPQSQYKSDGFVVQIHYKPLINCLWLSAVLAFISGIMSFTLQVYKYKSIKKDLNIKISYNTID